MLKIKPPKRFEQRIPEIIRGVLSIIWLLDGDAQIALGY